MNERIKELAEQARIKDHWSIDEARYLTNYLDEQKFAELIIQECVNAALEEIVSDEEIEDVESEGDRCYLEGNNGGVVDAVAAIKEHFKKKT